MSTPSRYRQLPLLGSHCEETVTFQVDSEAPRVPCCERELRHEKIYYSSRSCAATDSSVRMERLCHAVWQSLENLPPGLPQKVFQRSEQRGFTFDLSRDRRF